MRSTRLRLDCSLFLPLGKSEDKFFPKFYSWNTPQDWAPLPPEAAVVLYLYYLTYLFNSAVGRAPMERLRRQRHPIASAARPGI